MTTSGSWTRTVSSVFTGKSAGRPPMAMHTTTAPLPAAAIRVLYRSLLRACGRGARPEVFGWQHAGFDASALPQSSSEVVRRLHRAFTIAQAEQTVGQAEQTDPFRVLRHASSMARALHPAREELPSTLPAFILPSHCLMPHEMAEFVFFEPRYLRLAKRAIGLGSATPGDGRFFHLPAAETDGVGVVASILHHVELPDGRIAVHCLAGPRCRVTKAAHLEQVEAADGTAAPPLLHVEVRLATTRGPVLTLLPSCTPTLPSYPPVLTGGACQRPAFRGCRR